MTEQSQQKSSNPHIRRKKALFATIASTALLVTFATYTLLKTEFKTYPPEKQPAQEENRPSENFLSLASPFYPVEKKPDQMAAEEPLDVNRLQKDFEIERKIKASELLVLKKQVATFKDELEQRQAEIQYLHDELDAAKKQIDVASLTQPQEEKILDENVQRELVELQGKVKDYQDSYTHLENRSESLEKRNKELNDELTLSENRRLELEEQINKDRERVLTQDSSFDKLRNALKSHKEAMRRMEKARLELAGELEVTKQQYAKLLQVVAFKEKESSMQSGKIALADPLEKKSPRYHTVTQGETLTSISKKYYGTLNHWKEIHEANQSVLGDHDHLKVGVVLVIP